MALRQAQPPDRRAQRVVPDRGEPAHGPPHARLPAHPRPLVQARAARRRLDPARVPAGLVAKKPKKKCCKSKPLCKRCPRRVEKRKKKWLARAPSRTR